VLSRTATLVASVAIETTIPVAFQRRQDGLLPARHPLFRLRRPLPDHDQKLLRLA
jgi:hypothetical protein